MAYKAISKSEAKRFIHEVRKAHDVIIDRTYARKDTVTAAANGLTPQLPSIDADTKYLDGTGQWTTPNYTLPTMSPTVKGGAKNGTGLVMADDTVNVDLRTAVTVSATDAEPRVYVIRHIDDLIDEHPDLTENDLVELSGVENHKYLLIDDIYFVADANTPSGGLLFYPGEWYVPVRGQENFTVQSSDGYFDYEQGKFVVDDSTKKDLVAGQDFFIGLDDAEEQPILTFKHDGTQYPLDFNLLNATIWADGHDAVEGATSIGNIVLGNNLSLTGDTLNVSGSTYKLPTMSSTVKGGSKNGAGLVMTGNEADILAVDLRTAIETQETTLSVTNISEEEWSQAEPLVFYYVYDSTNDKTAYRIRLADPYDSSCKLLVDNNTSFTLHQDYEISEDEQGSYITIFKDSYTPYSFSSGEITLRMDSIGNIKIGNGLLLTNNTLNTSIPSPNNTSAFFKDNYASNMLSKTIDGIAGGLDESKIGEESWDINSPIGRALDASFQNIYDREPTTGDLVTYYAPGNTLAQAYRSQTHWFNLGVKGATWININPLLSTKDREKLDSLPYILPVATNESLGGVIVGDNISVSADGKVGVAVTYKEFSEQDVLDVFIND